MCRLRRMKEATTGAMRARTEVGGVCFCVHGASVRALCGDKVAARWPCQLHCARRCCRCARKLPALLTIRPQVGTFETAGFNSLKSRRIFTHSSFFIRPKGDTFKTAGFDTLKIEDFYTFFNPQDFYTFIKTTQKPSSQ